MRHCNSLTRLASREESTFESSVSSELLWHCYGKEGRNKACEGLILNPQEFADESARPKRPTEFCSSEIFQILLKFHESFQTFAETFKNGITATGLKL